MIARQAPRLRGSGWPRARAIPPAIMAAVRNRTAETEKGGDALTRILETEKAELQITAKAIPMTSVTRSVRSALGLCGRSVEAVIGPSGVIGRHSGAALHSVPQPPGREQG